MTVRRALFVVAGLALVGGGIYYATSHAARSVSEAARTDTAPRIAWRTGTRYLYSLSARAETSFPMGPRAVHADMVMEAELSVRAVGKNDGVNDLVIGLTSLGTYDVRAEDASLLTPESLEQDRRALLSQEVLARIDDRGGVRSISFRRSTPDRARRVLQRLVQALAVSLPEEPKTEWAAVETTPIGVAQTLYTVGAGDGSKITRSRLRYVKVSGLMLGEDELGTHEQQLTSHSQIDLGTDRSLVSITENEHLTIDMGENSPGYESTSKFALSPKSKAPFDPRTVEIAALDQDVSNAQHVADPRERDESRAATVTASAIHASVFTASAGGRIPRVFPGRVGAYLRLHPEEIATLVQSFRESELTPAGRAYIMDLLSIAGDATAQAGMRDALTADVEAKDPPSFAEYLQRFIFVGVPEVASAEFLEQTQDRAKATGDALADGSSLVALGSVVRALDDTGKESAAERFDARLRSELDGATGKRRVYALRALGNSAMPNDEAAILSYARDASPAVRDQVAESLRHFDDAASRASLLALAGDEDPDVASTAIKALSEGHLPAAEWQDLSLRVASAKTNAGADGALVALVRDHADEAGSVGRDILKAVRERTNPGWNQLIATIDGMLEAPESPVAAREP